MNIDRGVTHVALPVTDLDASLAFYEKRTPVRHTVESCTISAERRGVDQRSDQAVRDRAH
jgi:catechol 2,3-dioxygenase-like lactoylglutathione lyase family enzyme